MSDPSLAHLFGRVAVVEERVAEAVERRKLGDPNPDDPFRGLYLSPEGAARLLGSPPQPLGPRIGAERMTEVERHADGAEQGGARLRLRGLAHSFGLEPLDVDLLLVALAPDLDA